MLCPESIPQFLRDPIPQTLRGEYLHVRHPRQDPAYQFLAARRLHPHFDPPVESRPELLRGVPLPLGDVDGQFRLEQQPDLDRLLAARDAEGLPGVCFGAELGWPRESLSRRRDLPEPRQGECLDPGLGRVQRQRVPVPLVGEQVVGVQFVLGNPPVEGLVRRADRLAALQVEAVP